MFASKITPEEIAALEYASFGGEIKVISSKGPDYDAAIRYLRRQKMIGFDTETRPTFSVHQQSNGVALLQLSGPTKAFLFRVNLMELPKSLCGIMSNPSIIKIGAAVHDDIRALQKKKNFKAAGFVDLQRIVEQWGIMDKSVKKMAAIILGVRISKAQQLSNWEAPELSESQQKYAATDAWICLKMYKKLLVSEKVYGEDNIEKR